MKKYLIAAAIVLSLAAIIFGLVVYTKPVNNSEPAAYAYVDTTSSTYKQYSEMTGEMYDRSFIANMIVHHEGAVTMANLALENAKHQELKDMAKNIIADQEKEISQMTAWQKKWGYPSTSADNMMDHSAMGMMDEMSGMETSLDGKTGDDFDKAFIEQMSLHHQSAIDMAAPGIMNAKHQEIKDLTSAVVTAQSKEIKQMKQWQEQWGYEK